MSYDHASAPYDTDLIEHARYLAVENLDWSSDE